MNAVCKIKEQRRACGNDCAGREATLDLVTVLQMFHKS